MANVVENMSTQAHLVEAMRQLDRAHIMERSPGGSSERAIAAATIAQAHLMLVQLGVNEGRLPHTGDGA